MIVAQAPPSGLAATSFPSPLGWIGLTGDDRQRLVAVAFGHGNPAEVADSLSDKIASLRRPRGTAAPNRMASTELPEKIQLEELQGVPDWLRRVAERLLDYTEGHNTGDRFGDIPIAIDDQTLFQQQVIECCRRILPGQTVSYGQLAEQAGSPRAARAVGNVMRNNRLPLIVPCHRVVGSTGGLHGFSAPQGLAMKQRLLNLESPERLT